MSDGNARSRRELLKLFAATAPALALRHLAVGEAFAAKGPGGTGEKAPVYQAFATLNRYIDPLPRMPRKIPDRVAADGEHYHVRMVEFETSLHSQLPRTRVWGYDGHYPGPVFEARQGVAAHVTWENRLPARHLFPIDRKIHGAMSPTPAVRTVPHLHGARADQISDGLPEKWFVPGASVLYHYPNQQVPATLWYHDHSMGITRLNVYAGLSGMYLLRDPNEASMNLPSGEFEVPLILQDRTLDARGQLLYAPTDDSGQRLPQGQWGPQFYGELPVINGAIYPYLEVEPRAYRFRILNSSNARFYHLYLNLAHLTTDIPNLVPFHQIGSDGGLLPAPVQLTKLLLGTAERADLIVDFKGLEGRTVTLSNDAISPYPSWGPLLRNPPAPLPELMQFRVTSPLSPSSPKAYSLPGPVTFPPLEPEAAVKTRDFILSETMDSAGLSMGMRINGKGYDDPVTEKVELGSLEKWRFLNTTEDAHTMHLHLVQFRIIERQGFDPIAMQNGKVLLVGKARPAEPQEQGWKDTAIVNPRDMLTILVKCDGFTGRYVFHCHMLEHEDNDMMRPFEVVPVGANAKDA